MNYAIGIDIGGTNFRIGTVSEAGEITCFEKMSSDIFQSIDVIDVLYREISAYINKNNLKSIVKAIAIGIPAIVSKDKETIYSAPNLRGFDGIVFGDRLEKMLSIPVFLDRDVNFLLQNDIENLNLPKDKTVLGFYVGTGFGNAICIDGKFHRGKNGAAGELGHIPFIDIKEKCTCGNVGCAETRCSGRYLEKLCEEHFPGTMIRNVFKEHGESSILLKYTEDLAVPIATEINILDPDFIVLAGGVLFMEDFPKEILVNAIHKFTRKPYPGKNLKIYFSEHNDKSGIFGSGNFALKQIKMSV